jgi:hypothetical protein
MTGQLHKSRRLPWTRKVFSRCSLPAVLICLPAGCSSQDFEIAPVSGAVTLAGQPLANASVAFQPRGRSSTRVGPTSAGTTDSGGRFALRVISDDREGAVVGEHIVWISTSGVSQDASRGGRDRVPLKYQDGSLRFTVPPGGTDRANFDL